MAEPTLIRAQLEGGKAVVRMRMTHAMESGQRRDAAGKLVPAWHIQTVELRHNGKVVLQADWGTGVAKDPFLQFTLRAAKAGDKLSASWKDTRGDTRSDEITLA